MAEPRGRYLESILGHTDLGQLAGRTPHAAVEAGSAIGKIVVTA
jgi:hypothetical protein